MQKTISKKSDIVPSNVVMGKQLPHAVDAERSVLSALLLNGSLIHKVSEFLQPIDFYIPQHKIIFQSILRLTSQNKQIDLVSVQDDLTKANELEKAGGIVFLLALQEDIPSLSFIEQHARIIKEKSILRELIHASSQVIYNCYNQGEKTIDSVIDEAEKTIFQVSQKRPQQAFVQLNVWLKKTFQHLSDIKSHSKGITGIPSGFRALDTMTSGFQNGDLIVVAGRPSMGKTAFALSIATFAAKSKYSTGFFSLEMAAEQLTLRMLASESNIPHQSIRNATISSQEWIELTNVAAQLAHMNLFIDDSPMINVMELRAKARKLKTEHNLQFLIVDYLQLIHGDRVYENRHQEVSVISRSLKALAKELEIPVFALSQLSRAVDARMDKRPLLSDLRESGAIEQDADLILFLYRDVVYNKDTENPSQAEIIIGKQRNGPTGTVFLNFANEVTRFESDMVIQYEE